MPKTQRNETRLAWLPAMVVYLEMMMLADANKTNNTRRKQTRHMSRCSGSGNAGEKEMQSVVVRVARTPWSAWTQIYILLLCCPSQDMRETKGKLSENKIHRREAQTVG
jgi:hypothetical protein